MHATGNRRMNRKETNPRTKFMLIVCVSRQVEKYHFLLIRNRIVQSQPNNGTTLRCSFEISSSKCFRSLSQHASVFQRWRAMHRRRWRKRIKRRRRVVKHIFRRVSAVTSDTINQFFGKIEKIKILKQMKSNQRKAILTMANHSNFGQDHRVYLYDIRECK